MEKRKRAREASSALGNPPAEYVLGSPSQLTQGVPLEDAHVTRSGPEGAGSDNAEESRFARDGGLQTQEWSGVGLGLQKLPLQDQDQATDLIDHSDREGLPGRDMLDRANSGKPVLTGPEDLGMEQDDGQQQSPKRQHASTQLRKSDHDKPAWPTPDSQFL